MKPKNAGRSRRSARISRARLEAMVEEATVDCYNESEEVSGWFTMIDGSLAVPFETIILGVTVTVERVDLTPADLIVAVCSRGRHRQFNPHSRSSDSPSDT